MSKTIDTYKHNKVVGAYNRALKPKSPVLVGAAGGAAFGAVVSSRFHAATSREVAHRAVGGAVGGALGGALAGKSRQAFGKRMFDLHQKQQGKPATKLPYRGGK